MICLGCRQALKANKYLKCNTCSSELCFTCLGLTKEKYKLLTDEQIKSLNCPCCVNINIGPRRRNNNESVNRSAADRAISPREADKSLSVSDQAFEAGDAADASADSAYSNLMKEAVTMESISKLFDLKMSPDSSIMKNMRAALYKDIENIVQIHVDQAIGNLKAEFSSTTDFLAAGQSSLRKEIEKRDAEIKELQSDLVKSQSSLLKLQSRVAIIEKISRDMNIEIHEVPESKNEDLTALFKSLCDCLQVSIPEGEVRACRRVAKMDASSKRPRNILVTLSSQRLRDLFLSSVTRYNKSHPKDKLASTHIGLVGETRRIYVAEHLSPEVKEVHSATRRFCKENNFKYVWVRFGQIYVRKNDESPAILIKNIDFLSKIKC